MKSGVEITSDRSSIELVDFVTQQRFSTAEIQDRFGRTESGLLAQSRYLHEPNFKRIHPRDLEILFALIDRAVFIGSLSRTLGDQPLRFRLSTRMASAGGKTIWSRSREGTTRYFEITIACGLLFQGFSTQDRAVQVCGLTCESRLQALIRIFEHELVHLVEYVCWRNSNCSGPRFQDIAARLFGHCSHMHELITWRERARTSGIDAGSMVSFVFDGTRFSGRVNRVTKRATVLVQDETGQTYSDGQRYRKFFVPLASLEPID